jgi:hypothetical protein
MTASERRGKLELVQGWNNPNACGMSSTNLNTSMNSAPMIRNSRNGRKEQMSGHSVGCWAWSSANRRAEGVPGRGTVANQVNEMAVSNRAIENWQIIICKPTTGVGDHLFVATKTSE